MCTSTYADTKDTLLREKDLELALRSSYLNELLFRKRKRLGCWRARACLRTFVTGVAQDVSGPLAWAAISYRHHLLEQPP